MKKLKIVRRLRPTGNFAFSSLLYRCPIATATLESGERLRRGCGQRGLMESASGWKCFYCGNFIYRARENLEELWFHFRLGREYWRVQTFLGTDFINGVPVSGNGDSLPIKLWPDLGEARVPKWFAKFLVLEEREFEKYFASVSQHVGEVQ